MQESVNPIAIVINGVVQFQTIQPAVDELKRRGLECDFYVPALDETYVEGWHDAVDYTYQYIKARGYNVIFATKTPDVKYKISLFPYYFISFLHVHSDYYIRFQYSMSKPNATYNPSSLLYFDAALCYGPYDEALTIGSCKTFVVGPIKFSDFKERKKETKGKKRVLYLPTWDNLSSIECVLNELKQLSGEYNITVKVHHCTTFLEKGRVSQLREAFVNVVDHNTLLTDLLLEADVVLSDTSGAIFDAIAADVPICTFRNTEDIYFEDVLYLEHKLVNDDAIPGTRDISSLKKIIDQALYNEEYAVKRRKIRDELFPVRGRECIDRFMDVINILLNDGLDEHYRASRKKIREFIYNNLMSENTKLISYTASLKEDIAKLTSYSECLKEDIAKLTNSNTGLLDDNCRVSQQLDLTQIELNNIYNSKGYKLLLKYYKLRDGLIKK